VLEDPFQVLEEPVSLVCATFQLVSHNSWFRGRCLPGVVSGLIMLSITLYTPTQPPTLTHTLISCCIQLDRMTGSGSRGILLTASTVSNLDLVPSMGGPSVGGYYVITM